MVFESIENQVKWLLENEQDLGQMSLIAGVANVILAAFVQTTYVDFAERKTWRGVWRFYDSEFSPKTAKILASLGFSKSQRKRLKRKVWRAYRAHHSLS